MTKGGIMKRHAILGSLLVASSAMAAAQSPSYEPPKVDPLAVVITNDYTKCVVGRDPRRAAALLVDDYTSDAHKHSMRDFALSNSMCLHGGKLRFSDLIISGDMAEAMLRREHVTADQIAQFAAADTSRATPRCMVQKQPRKVAALLQTPPASSEEHDAVAALIDTFAGCTTKGQTAAANVVGLRAQLALATYRMINDQAPTSAGN